MNITEETNDYFSTTENWKQFVKEYNFEKKHSSVFSFSARNIIKCELAEDNLKDKLKATPDRGIKRISKAFRVDWSKIFKRGWLLWK